MIKHMASIHEEKDSYMCEICARKYSSAQAVRNHVKLVHNDGGEECEYCHKKFKDKTTLTMHVSSLHLGEKNFVCDECGFRTARKNYTISYLLVM